MIKNKSKVLAAIGIITLCACGVRVSSTGKIQKYAETYYKGEGKLLFYVKPIDLKSEDKDLLKADFTYNKGDSVIKDITINMRIYGEPPFTKADSIKLVYGPYAHCDTSIKLIFNENTARKTYSRQGMDIPDSCFDEVLSSDKLTFITYIKGKETKYYSGKQWRKSHQKLYQMIYW